MFFVFVICIILQTKTNRQRTLELAGARERGEKRGPGAPAEAPGAAALGQLLRPGARQKSVCLFVCLFVCLLVCLSCLFLCLFVCLFV